MVCGYGTPAFAANGVVNVATVRLYGRRCDHMYVSYVGGGPSLKMVGMRK